MRGISPHLIPQVVVGWGPDCKMIAKTLVAEKINCELFILNYMEPANSLIRYLDELAQKGIATEVAGTKRKGCELYGACRSHHKSNVWIRR